MKKQKLRRGQRPCEKCGKSTSLRGWYFVTHPGKKWSLRSGKKEYHWWCDDHFRIRMFNSYPFTCTDACNKKRCERLGMQWRRDGDHYVWLNLAVAMETDTSVPPVKIGEGESFALKPSSPKCPWCGEGMTVVQALFDDRKSKRKKNPRTKP